MTLTTCAKQQLEDCSRLGFRNQFGEWLETPDFEIKEDEWSSLIVHEGYFCSLGLKRFYIKDSEIKVNDKNHIPYRGFIMPVMDKDVIVVQCLSGDFVILRIIANNSDLQELEKYIRRDNELSLGMSYEDFKEANRRDLELHKKIVTQEAIFNKHPERLDADGMVVTSLDHYDNFEYQTVNSSLGIYQVYDAEKEIRRIDKRIMYLEDKKMDYDYSIDEKYINNAVDAFMSLDESDMKYFNKGGEYIFKNLENICFQTELNKGQVWQVWKYLNWVKIEKEIQDLYKIIKEIEETGKVKTPFEDDDPRPCLFRSKHKSHVVEIDG